MDGSSYGRARLRGFLMLLVTTASLVAIGAFLTSCNGTAGLLPGVGFPKTVAWTSVTVNRGAGTLPAVVLAVDLNADGLVDAVAGYPGSMTETAQIIAFVQQSPTIWIAVVLASGQGVSGVSSLAAGDIDGDGLMDVIAGCNGQIVYLRQPSLPIATGAWFADVIAQSQATNIGRWSDVAIVQIDRQFGSDIVACNSSPGLLAWFRAPVNAFNGSNWQRFDIDAQARDGASCIIIDDVDRDGNPDVISSARRATSTSIAWYAHPGNNLLNGQPWRGFAIGNMQDAIRMDIGDFDRDGRPDLAVISASQLQAAWYQKPVDPLTQAWTGYVLADFTQNTPTQIRVVDVDVNGQPDVVISTANTGVLRWFTPVNDVRARWVENNLADVTENIGRFDIADVDRDARLDVVAPLVAQDAANDSIAWFRNPER